MLNRLTLAVLLGATFAFSLPCAMAGATTEGSSTAAQAAIEEAAGWIRRADKIESEYNYVMTCKVRLLLFWAGSDDVGGGYVRIGRASDNAREQMIQVLFGSDPAKAPLAINRWGAGTEVLRSSDSGQPTSSAFFGFMKSSKGQSVSAMEKELVQEKDDGAHLFEAIISRVDQDQALTTSVPYTSSRDYDLHQYPEAEKVTLHQLENNPARHIDSLEGTARDACPRAGEFLSTTLQLMDDAVAGHATPITYCYLYNARHYTITLLSVRSVGEKTVHVKLRGNAGTLDRHYHHLKDTHFAVRGRETGSKSVFDILLGTEGNLRGAPIQITYEPNWWFQVVLNLASNSPRAGDADLEAR